MELQDRCANTRISLIGLRVGRWVVRILWTAVNTMGMRTGGKILHSSPHCISGTSAGTPSSLHPNSRIQMDRCYCFRQTKGFWRFSEIVVRYPLEVRTSKSIPRYIQGIYRGMDVREALTHVIRVVFVGLM